jgi:hypothetical protein
MKPCRRWFHQWEGWRPLRPLALMGEVNTCRRCGARKYR